MGCHVTKPPCSKHIFSSQVCRGLNLPQTDHILNSLYCVIFSQNSYSWRLFSNKQEALVFPPWQPHTLHLKTWARGIERGGWDGEKRRKRKGGRGSRGWGDWRKRRREVVKGRNTTKAVIEYVKEIKKKKHKEQKTKVPHQTVLTNQNPGLQTQPIRVQLNKMHARPK